MVSVGEETGNLDGMLSKIADFYDTEVDYMLASLTSLLEPMMILGMGFIVGFIVISVFLPLYQIIGNIH
jgi:type IV pilus assembly protein PilC